MLAASLLSEKDTLAFKPSTPNASAAVWNSKPTLSPPLAKVRVVGALVSVAEVIPCSPEAPGTEAK